MFSKTPFAGANARQISRQSCVVMLLIIIGSIVTPSLAQDHGYNPTNIDIDGSCKPDNSTGHCDTNSHCAEDKNDTNRYRCTCNDNYAAIWLATGVVCLEKLNSLKDECRVHQQCENLLGQQRAVCLTNQCMCNEELGFSMITRDSDEPECEQLKGLNETCTSGKECQSRVCQLDRGVNSMDGDTKLLGKCAAKSSALAASFTTSSFHHFFPVLLITLSLLLSLVSQFLIR